MYAAPRAGVWDMSPSIVGPNGLPTAQAWQVRLPRGTCHSL